MAVLNFDLVIFSYNLIRSHDPKKVENPSSNDYFSALFSDFRSVTDSNSVIKLRAKLILQNNFGSQRWVRL